MAAAPNLTPRKTVDASSNSELHQRILNATVELFVEDGYSQVTTNMIAQRADVSVGSIYRFYPNKYALFNAIACKWFAAVDRTLDEFLSTADADAPWEVQLDLLTEPMSELYQQNHRLIQAWGVLSGNPEVRKADDDYAAKSAGRIAAYFEKIAPGRSAAEYKTMSSLVYWTSLQAFDLATLSPGGFEHDVIAQYKKMMKAYLRDFLAQVTPA